MLSVYHRLHRRCVMEIEDRPLYIKSIAILYSSLDGSHTSTYVYDNGPNILLVHLTVMEPQDY